MHRWLLIFSILLVVAAGCTGAPAPTAPPEPKPTAGLPAASDRESQWEKTVAKAREEGVVTMMTTAWPPRSIAALAQGFKDKYGINLEHSPSGRGPEMAAKVKAEQRAGLYLYDFFGMGATTAINLMKPDGLLGPVEPLLVLPEVKDPRSWKEGKLPFVDKDKQFFGMAAFKQLYIVYNTGLIRQGEITTYTDLLKPEYKGKIVLNDPTTTGAGVAMLTHLAFDLWDTERAKEFLRSLIRDQKAVIERDNRLHVETVARGKFAIGAGASPEIVASFIDAGAPVSAVTFKEGTLVTPAAGGATAPTRMAHPNAGMVFLNWLLSREGQSVFARAWGAPSMRTDVPSEGINPIYMFQPGEKLFLFNEEKALGMGQWIGISKQVIDQAMK